MTEPIESWIHTIPGFQAAQQVPAVEEVSIEPIVKEASTEPSVEETSVEPIVKETSSEATVDEAEQKPISISGKPGTDTAAIKALESTAVLTAVESLAIAAPIDEIDDDEPVLRTTKSDAATEERRHTCDLSQATIPDTPTPPVPAIPKEIAPTNAALEGRDYRVSFGSAFGNRNGSATDTGRIRSIYHEGTNGSLEEHAEDTVEANDGEHAHTLEAGTIVQDVTDKATHKATLEATMPAAQTETSSRKEEVRADTSIQAVETQTKPLSVSTTRERPSESDTTGQTQSHYSPSEASPVAILPSTANGVSGTIAAIPISTAAVATGAAMVTGTSRTAYTYGQNSSQVHVPGTTSQLNNSRYQHITDSSGASIGRSKYRASPNGSISSMSTDYHNGRRGSIGSNYDVTSTDPTMIQVITQTMIGDYLWKYTRRPMGNAISEKRHRRYFWVHPYTKTMYWSLSNPGAEGSREQRAKSGKCLFSPHRVYVFKLEFR